MLGAIGVFGLAAGQLDWCKVRRISRLILPFLPFSFDDLLIAEEKLWYLSSWEELLLQSLLLLILLQRFYRDLLFDGQVLLLWLDSMLLY